MKRAGALLQSTPPRAPPELAARRAAASRGAAGEVPSAVPSAVPSLVLAVQQACRGTGRDGCGGGGEAQVGAAAAVPRASLEDRVVAKAASGADPLLKLAAMVSTGIARVTGRSPLQVSTSA